MGTHHLVQLGPDHAEIALAYCQRRPHRTTFLAGWIQDGGLSEDPRAPRAWLFADIDDEGAIQGLVYISDTGIVLPVSSQADGLDGLVEIARRNPTAVRVIVGERTLVASLWRRIQPFGFTARIDRNQLGYSVSAGSFADTTSHTLVRASDTHLDQLVEASAAMAREEARDDPQSRNPALFRSRIHDRVKRGRDFLFEEGGRVTFKCNVSALSKVGGQIEGIYTVPTRRRTGLGRAGTIAVTAWVLERSPRAFLLVNDDNEAALRLYESLGYEKRLESRTIFVK
ncbi:MAG: GNAT family N-acetyltransferase [Deltaproteobacteria bacterium]